MAVWGPPLPDRREGRGRSRAPQAASGPWRLTGASRPGLWGSGQTASPAGSPRATHTHTRVTPERGRVLLCWGGQERPLRRRDPWLVQSRPFRERVKGIQAAGAAPAKARGRERAWSVPGVLAAGARASSRWGQEDEPHGDCGWFHASDGQDIASPVSKVLQAVCRGWGPPRPGRPSAARRLAEAARLAEGPCLSLCGARTPGWPTQGGRHRGPGRQPSGRSRCTRVGGRLGARWGVAAGPGDGCWGEVPRVWRLSGEGEAWSEPACEFQPGASQVQGREAGTGTRAGRARASRGGAWP